MFDGLDYFSKAKLKHVADNWVKAQTYDVVDAATSATTEYHVWLNIAVNANHKILAQLAKNRHVTDEVLHAMLSNRSLNLDDSSTISALIAAHKNCSTDTIVSLWNKIHWSHKVHNSKTLEKIAKHKNTPECIVMDLLPKDEDNLNKMFLRRENIGACYSKVIPARMALSATVRHISQDSFHYEKIWAAQFPRFAREHKKLTGVNVRDWPKEWVVELVK